MACPEEIAVILKEFLEAGPGYVCELQFRFFGSAAGLARFQDVLLAGPRSLDHLVVSAVALVQKTLAEPHRPVIDDPRFAKRQQFLVTSMRRYEIRPIRPISLIFQGGTS
ncbi:MAG: hypothetical protein AB9869_29285 [Verrucomicrobiia bacterium]